MDMSPTWWTRLPYEDQIKYLKAHPRSKMKPKRAPIKRGKKGAKKVVRSKKPAGIPQEELRTAGEDTPEDNKPVEEKRHVTRDELKAKLDAAESAELDKDIPKVEPLASKKPSIEAVGKHQEEVKQALTSRLDEEVANIPDTISSMSPKELSKVGKLIKSGVEKESGKHLLAAAGIMLAKASLIAVGLGVAASVGIVPTVYMLGLFNYKDSINRFVDAPLRKVVTDFTEGLYQGMKEAVQDATKVRDNLVANEPTTTISPDDKRESASAPNHMSDVVKSLASLSKKDYSTQIEKASGSKLMWVRANDLLTNLYAIEFDLRKLNNLYMRFRLSSDTSNLSKSIMRIKELTATHKRIREALFGLASTQTHDKNLDVARQFGKLLSSKEITQTYILDDKQLTPCWLITAENIRATNSLMPRVFVYIACSSPPNTLKVAVAMNSTITPSHMQTYDKKMRPQAIMSEYGLT